MEAWCYLRSVIFSGLLHPLAAWVLSPCPCEHHNVSAQHRRKVFPPSPSLPPPTHKPPQPPPPALQYHHTTTSNSYSICRMIRLCFCRQCQPPPYSKAPNPPPEPLTWLTAFVFRIKYEADECVCGANYDIAPCCQNVLRTKFLPAGPQG